MLRLIQFRTEQPKRASSSSACQRVASFLGLLLLLCFLINPIVQALTVPGDLDGVELHARDEDGALLCVLLLGARAQHGAEAVVVDPILVCHHKVTPPLLALGALHLSLVYRGGRVKLGEVLEEVLVDLVINLGQAQGAPLDLFENGPVCLEVLDSCSN